MFPRKTVVAVLEEEPKKAPPPPQNPKPRKVQPQGNSEEVQQYVFLCQKIRAETPVVRMLQLRQFLAERGIPEYDINEVDQHLTRLAAQRNQETNDPHCYYWHPLREEDKGTSFRWWWNLGGEWRCRSNGLNEVYHKLVPPSVLETVVTIMEKFPDAKFFVSDISHVKDPFLAVTFQGQWPVIVDFWDEPDFRPSK
jgi:hypothetical protein